MDHYIVISNKVCGSSARSSYRKDPTKVRSVGEDRNDMYIKIKSQPCM